MTGLDRQRNGFFVIIFLYFVHNIMHVVYDAVDFIYMMHICYNPVNLYYVVSVCTVFLVREHSCPLTLRSLTLYIYGAPILDVSRSHTTTQHCR